MEVVKRRLRLNQITQQPQLREAQQRLYKDHWSHDLEVYNNNGELAFITSRDNPNLPRLLAELSDQQDAAGSLR